MTLTLTTTTHKPVLHKKSVLEKHIVACPLRTRIAHGGQKRQRPALVPIDATTKVPIVRFSKIAKVRARYSTEEDLKNSWYSGEDYGSFEADARHTTMAVCVSRKRKESGNERYVLDPTKICSYGLEDSMSRECKQQKRYRTRLHLHHVLKQQYIQRLEGRSDLEMLRTISRIGSEESSQLSQQRGACKVLPPLDGSAL